MTTTVNGGTGTAAGLLFGPGADAAEALARQIMPARGRPGPGPAAAAWGHPEGRRARGRRHGRRLLDVRLDGLLLAGWRLTTT